MKTRNLVSASLEAVRQSAIGKFVEKGIAEDKKARAGLAVGAVAVGATVVVASGSASLPAKAPVAAPVPNTDNTPVLIQSLAKGTTAPTDTIGAIADQAAQQATGRQDGKKNADSFEGAAPAFKFRTPVDINGDRRDRSLDTGRGPVDNAFRAGGDILGERVAGREPHGNGPDRIFFGGRFEAPQIADEIPQFKPVE
jgi:hypothetical protein